MKFLTIDASKSMNPNTGESWYRAEAKVSLDENEVPEEVFAALKARLDGWLPNPYETHRNQEQTERKAGMVESINACTSLDVLKTFALLAKGNPEHKAAYDKRYLELSK